MIFWLCLLGDPAYRIGQERPVIIYRLVAEGTIEEKILRLHDTKRSLADALLEGADMSSCLSKDALLALLSSKEDVQQHLVTYNDPPFVPVDKAHFRCGTRYNNQSEYAKKVC